MTAQTGDWIFYKNEKCVMINDPLNAYFSDEHPRPDFQFTNTGNWRGYICTWEVTDGDELFLVDIQGQLKDGTQASMESIFPGQKRVLAAWVNETLALGAGKLLQYIDMGFTAVFERQIILGITDGKVTSVLEGNGKDMLQSPFLPRC